MNASVFEAVITFACLLFVGLIAGMLFGIWLGYDPAPLSAEAYVEQQQNAIRSLNVKMPLFGLFAIVLLIVAAIQARAEPMRLGLLVGAAGCLIVSGLVTRFLNQPINAVVMTWSVLSPPGDWTHWRDEWWRWHVVRTATSFLGLCLLITATVQRHSAPV